MSGLRRLRLNNGTARGAHIHARRAAPSRSDKRPIECGRNGPLQKVAVVAEKPPKLQVAVSTGLAAARAGADRAP